MKFFKKVKHIPNGWQTLLESCTQKSFQLPKVDPPNSKQSLKSVAEGISYALSWENRSFQFHPEVEIAPLEPDYKGRPSWILKGPEGHYFRCGPEGLFLYNQIKNQPQTLSDISFEYFMKTGRLGDELFRGLIQKLEQLSFLTRPYRGIKAALSRELGQRQGWFKRALKQVHYIHNIHHLVAALYRWGGKFFCKTEVNVFLMMLFCYALSVLGHVIDLEALDLFRVQGSVVLGMATLVLVKVAVTSVHELAHALSVVHYGRKVIKGGVITQMGIPNFFVDTNDIWMEKKRARITVSLAGPYSTLILMIPLILLPYFGVESYLFRHDILLKILLLCGLSVVVNINPILNYDGYYVLVDFLGLPMLRQRSLLLVKKIFSNFSLHRNLFYSSRKNLLLVSYWLFSVIWTVVSLALVVWVFSQRFGAVWMEFYHSNSLAIQVAALGLLTVIFFPLFFLLGHFFWKVCTHWGKRFLQSPWWLQWSRRTLSLTGLVLTLLLFTYHLPPVLFSTVFLSSILLAVVGIWHLWPLLSFASHPWKLAWHFPMHLLGLALQLGPNSGQWVGWILFFLSFFKCLGEGVRAGSVAWGVINKFTAFAAGAMLISTTLLATGELTFIACFLLWSTQSLLMILFLKQLRPRVIKKRPLSALGDGPKLKSVYRQLQSSFFQMVREQYGAFLCKQLQTQLQSQSQLDLNKITSDQDMYPDHFPQQINQALPFFAAEIVWWKSVLSLVIKKNGQRDYIMRFLEGLFWIEREVFEEYLGEFLYGDIEARKSHSPLPLAGRGHFLRRSALFSQMSEEELQHVMQKFKLKAFAKGEVMTREGQAGDLFFMVLKGTLKVYRKKNIPAELWEGRLGKLISILNRGDCFGEAALLTRSPRNASVVGESAGEVLVMKRRDFENLLEEQTEFRNKVTQYGQRQFKFVEFLKNLAIFRNIDSEQINLVGQAINFSNYQRGEVLVKQGERGDSFYIIKSGTVRLHREEAGKMTPITEMGKGEYFGEISLFKDSPRTATVEAISETTVLKLTREDFQKIFNDNLDMEKVATRRLKEIEFSHSAGRPD